MDSKKVEALVSRVGMKPVVGSSIIYLNTDDPENLCQGWLGKVVGEENDNGTIFWTVRWFTGDVENGIKPEHCAHV